MGDYKTILADDERDIFVFSRSSDAETTVVAINNSGKIQRLRLNLPGKYWLEMISGDQYISIDDQLELSIDAKSGMILIPGMETHLAMENH